MRILKPIRLPCEPRPERAGEREGMLEPAHRETCRRFFPNSRLEMLPTGHWVHAEAPDRFAALVDGFCREEKK